MNEQDWEQWLFFTALPLQCIMLNANWRTRNGGGRPGNEGTATELWRPANVHWLHELCMECVRAVFAQHEKIELLRS